MKNLLFAGALAALAMVVIWSVNSTEQIDPSLEKLNRLRPQGEKAPKPEYPSEAAAYMASLRQTPNDENPAELSYRARQQTIADQNRQSGLAQLVNFKFEEMGPGNYGGRVRAIAINPSDENMLLIGGIDGGIWKSLDQGETWAPQNDFLTNLAISSMVVDPDNSTTVFAGTGEGFFNVDAARGLGIFRSDDFGTTWVQLLQTNNANFHYVNRLAMIPGTDIIIAATRRGIFRSTDLGNTWNEVSGVTTDSRGFVDLKLDPSDTSRLYAYHYGGGATRFVMRSTDSGATWTQLGAAQGVPTTNISRMEIGIGSDGVVYLAVSNGSTQTNGMYRSPAGGNAFVKTASNTPFIERQGWYDLIMAVDPSNSDRVFSGAVDIYSSTNAGATITRATFWNPSGGQIPQYVHADIHNITFFPSDSQKFLVGCDGGIFITKDGGLTFDDLNNNLRITQYYGLSVSPDGTRANAGTQDNGQHLFYGDPKVWIQWHGGDGGFGSWDQQDPNFIYGSTPGGGMRGSNNGGNTQQSIALPGGSGAQFIQPFTIDPNNGNRMIVGGTSVFYEDNLRALDGSWQSISGTLGTINATTISLHDGDVAYVGTTGGLIFETTNLGTGAVWNNISTGLPSGAVTWIEVDPTDNTGNTLYATFGNFSNNRVWRSTDGGDSWASVSGNLPDIPVFCVRVDPTDSAKVFLGTELGLWGTDNINAPSPRWNHYNYGVAWTRIMQMHWADDNTMWITTHGRSNYRAIRNPLEISFGTLLDPDCDADGYLENGGTGEIPITITNRGGFSVTGVSLALSSAYPGLSVDNSPQSVGTINPGASQTVNIQVTLNTLQNCLDVANLTATVTHNDGTANANTSITLGAEPDIQSGTFTEGAEGATLFTTEALLDVNDWAQVSTQANSGTNSWFAADINNYADKSLVSPWLEVSATQASVLSFSLYYNMEGNATQYWDGAVLELRVQGGEWFDIGHQSTIPYDGQLFGNSSLEYRNAWSGDQTSWRDGSVNLGMTYAGQTVQFRFRVAADANSLAEGFWVDDISMTNVSWLQTLNCDTSICQPACFNDLAEAQAEVMAQLPDWPATNSITNYITILNNICAP